MRSGSRAARPPLQAVAVLLLLVPLMAGCFDGPGTASFDLPDPQTGARYVYDGPGQGRLAVEIGGSAVRVDGQLTPHDVLVMEGTYRRPDDRAGDHDYTLWEAADQGTGHVVQQVARCIPHGYGERRDDPPKCLDDRALVILAGAAGMPAAFGTGPLWDRDISAGTVSVPLHTQGATRAPDVLRYEATPHDAGPECLELKATSAIDRLRPLQPTVAEGPFVVCPDHALPVAFTTFQGDRYRLVDHAPGSEPAPSTDTAWPTGDPAVPLRSWSAPFAIDPDDGQPWNFSVAQAHAWAMDNHSRYRNIVDGDPAGLVVHTSTGWTGSTSVADLRESETSERKLLAVRPDGDGVLLTLERTENRSEVPTEEDEESVELVDEQNISWNASRVPTNRSLADRQADAEAAWQLAEQLGRTPLASTGLIQSPTLRAPKVDLERNSERRWDGYSVLAWMEEEPPYPAEGQGGLVLRTPHSFVVDGPTGAVEYLELNRTHLPLRQHV